MLGEYEKGLLITNQGRVMYKLTSVIPTSRMALYYACKPTESAVCCSESEGWRENLTSQKRILKKMVIFFFFFFFEDRKTFEKRFHLWIWRKVFFVLSRAWDIEKFWVPTRKWTSDLRILSSDALPLSHRNFMVSEVYYEVHMSRILHTARIINVDSVMFVNRIRVIWTS